MFRGYFIVCTANVYVPFMVSTMTDTNQSEDKKIETAMFTFITYAFGTIIGPTLFGPFMDKYGYKKSLIFIQILLTICCILFIVQNEIQVFNAVTGVALFFIGMSEFTTHAYITTLLGFEFQSWGNLVPFGAMQMVVNFVTGLLSLFLTIWTVDTQSGFRLIFIILFLFGHASLILLFFFDFKKK